MTPVRLADGLPQRGEQPVVLVAARWPQNVPNAKARGLAGEWAALGLTGIACEDAVAADMARRAGLLAVVPAELAGDAPHLLAAAAEHGVAETVAQAFELALGGARFVVGELDEVAPLAMVLAVADADAPWRPLPSRPGWQMARAGDLLLAFGADGGDVEIAVRAGQSIHWFDPADGSPLAISTPEPDDQHTVRVPPGTPMALLVAPSRFVAAEVDASQA